MQMQIQFVDKDMKYERNMLTRLLYVTTRVRLTQTKAHDFVSFQR